MLQIGHQRRSNPHYLHLRDKILGERKLAGRITHLYGQWHRGVRRDGAGGCPGDPPGRCGFGTAQGFSRR